MAVSDRLCLIGIFLQLTITLQSSQAMKITNKNPGESSFMMTAAGPGPMTIKNGELSGGTVKIFDAVTVFKKCANGEDFCDEKGEKVGFSEILHSDKGSETFTAIEGKLIKVESDSKNSTSSSIAYQEQDDGTYVKVGDKMKNRLTPEAMVEMIKSTAVQNEKDELKPLTTMTAEEIRTKAFNEIKDSLTDHQIDQISTRGHFLNKCYKVQIYTRASMRPDVNNN